MKTYQEIKAIILNGEHPSTRLIEEAIITQTVEVAKWSRSLAKHTAKVAASEAHPFPLPEGEMERVGRRLAMVNQAQARLTRLFVWMELIKVARPISRVEGASA